MHDTDVNNSHDIDETVCYLLVIQSQLNKHLKEATPPAQATVSKLQAQDNATLLSARRHSPHIMQIMHRNSLITCIEVV